ncbi:XRE family transcriptional regulator [Lactobacillus acidophilus]
MKLSNEQVTAIKRKKGELDLSNRDLEKITGVSRWTLASIFKHDHRNVTSMTFKRLNDWLISEYNHDLVKGVK